tara:strand:- start:1664 stop:1876 length:213 start_codon:yes stop_codon:yes gene_type:complete
MVKKRYKKKKEFECIDCEEITSDYYTIQTNKGNIYKCAACYEDWTRRMVRSQYASQQTSPSGGLNYADEG